MIQSPQNYAAPQNVNTQPATQQKKPVYAPSYNAVQINLDTPTLNAPQPSYYYDYPQAPTQPYYPPVQPQQPQAPAQQQPVNVPEPVVEQTQPQTTTTQATTTPVDPKASTTPAEAAPTTPAAPVVDTAAVVANLSSPDFDKQSLQMEEIAQKGLANQADAVPYIQEDILNKLIDIVNVDSSKLDGPTERQLQLREKVMQNDATIYQAVQQGKDPKTVELPNKLTPEEEALANTITPIELAERNKEYALLTIAVLQKTFGDEIEKRSGKVVPLTDLPCAATVVNELKSNQNPAIRTAAIDSLRFIQRPEYKDDLTKIYTIAQSDADDGVVAAATSALNSLNAPVQQQAV